MNMNKLNNKENITKDFNSPQKQQENSSKRMTESNSNIDQANFKFSSKPSLENIRAGLELFCKDRNWEQYHTPRNLLLGILVKVHYLIDFMNKSQLLNNF